MLRIVFIAALLCFDAALSQNFVAMVNNCRENHLDRNNECLASAIMKMRPRMSQGIPELNLPPMDPFALEPVNFIQETGPVQVRAKYTNLLAYGLSRFELKYFDWHFQDNVLYMGAVIPSVTMRGKYNISGHIFELPIEGAGDYLTLMQGVVFNSKSNLGLDKDGKVYVMDTSLDFKIKKSAGKMDNLFNGNQVLSDTMHHFLKENNDLIMNEVRPEISRQLGIMLNAIIRSIVSSLPKGSLSDLTNDNINDKHRKRTNERKAAANRGGSNNNRG